MNSDMRAVCQSIVEKAEQARRLEAELKELKARVLEYHAGQKMVCEDGFESVVKHTVRDTPQVKAIAEAFGIEGLDFEHHAECFRRAEYDSVCIRKLVCG